jgi:hypothetical protein
VPQVADAFDKVASLTQGARTHLAPLGAKLTEASQQRPSSAGPHRGAGDARFFERNPAGVHETTIYRCLSAADAAA